MVERKPFNFRFVDDVVCASGNPISTDELAFLKSKGVTTIVNLTGISGDISKFAGLRELDYSGALVDRFEEVQRSFMARFLRLVEESRKKGTKVLVHCGTGSYSDEQASRTARFTAAYTNAKASAKKPILGNFRRRQPARKKIARRRPR